MWKIEKVTATNLMTFDDLDYTINQGVVTVIYGENKDNDSQKSNGAGKSALLEAIAAGITGGPLRKIKNGELVQNGKKECSIKLTMFNEQINERIGIERLFYPKKSSQVFIYINGIEIKHLTSTNEANAYIEERLGISGQDLMDYFILSKSRFESFLDASDTKKKEVINRFSNGYLVDSAVEELEADIAAAKEQVSVAEVSHNQLFGKVEGIRESIQEAQLAPDASEGIAEQKAELFAKKESLEYSLHDVLVAKQREDSELEAAEERLEKLEERGLTAKLKKDRTKVKFELDAIHTEMNELREELSDVRIKIKELDSKAANTAECPKCAHEFSLLDPKVNLNEILNEVLRLKEDEVDIIADGKVAKRDYDACQLKLQEIENSIRQEETLLENATNTVHRLKRTISKQEGDISAYNSRIATIQSKIDNLQAPEQRDLITPLREKLAQLEPKLAEKEEVRNEAKAYQQSLLEQKDVFKRFKTHLANKSIQTIESITNDYLSLIGSDIAVKLEGETVLSSGKTNDKMSANLYRDGMELGSFHKNSNGEKAKINLAFILSLQKLISLNAGEGKGLDILIIDEILEAADAVGHMAIIRALNRLEVTVLMVSHAALDANYEHKITIEKVNGRSTINLN